MEYERKNSRGTEKEQTEIYGEKMKERIVWLSERPFIKDNRK
jgi:hypothetical protein